MARREGPGAIRHIDIAKHGDVAIRDMLLRNDSAPTENDAKLQRLSAARARLIYLRSVENDLKEAGRRVRFPEIQRIEKEFGDIDDITKQIEKTFSEMNKAAAADSWPAIWQERAVQLMVIHKLLDTRCDDNTASPGGSTITTHELQEQLAAEGFQVDERQLRRFMRVCGVVGKQGKRTDLHAIKAPDFGQ